MGFETVWDAIEDTSEAVAIMRLRSDLMIAIEQTVDGWGVTQARAAKRLGVSQPRLNDLLRGRIGKFSLDALVGLAVRAGLYLHLEVDRPGEARVEADPVADGYKALATIAASVKNNGQVAPVTVRDLLKMFGAKFRGVRTNRMIREVLLENGIRIEPDLNAQELDGLVEFHHGVVIDETERRFLENYRELHEGSLLNEIEAAMLNKLYAERLSDCLAGWIDRNPGISERQIRAQADALYKLGFDELEKVDGAEIIALPEPRSRTNLPPLVDHSSKHVMPNTAVSGIDSQLLRGRHERLKMNS
jgi:predicted XRE-type DNA-binding protein